MCWGPIWVIRVRWVSQVLRADKITIIKLTSTQQICFFILSCWEVVSSLLSRCSSQLNANNLYLLFLLILLIASLFSIVLVYIFWNNLKVTEKVPSAVQITIFLNYLMANWEQDVPTPSEYWKYFQYITGIFSYTTIIQPPKSGS